MYERISRREAIDRFAHIYDLYRRDAHIETDGSRGDQARLRFLSRIMDHLRHRRSTLSPRMLAGLTRYAALTVGAAFELAGYPLDGMREVEYALNGHRTRVVESYPYSLDCGVDLPVHLLGPEAFEHSAFVADVVYEWQKHPIRSVLGKGWRREKTFYIQMGTNDSVGLSALPPGAMVAIAPVASEEITHPDPESIYCLQFGDGYRCCGCAIEKGRLHLVPYNSNYRGRCVYASPAEVRIVGKALYFATALPVSPHRVADPAQKCGNAPLILPWEQPNPAALWQAEYLRLGLHSKALARANEILSAQLGVTISPRTLRRYRHEDGIVPHTGQLLAMSLLHCARFGDVFRLLGFSRDDAGRYPLTDWIEARSLRDLTMTRHIAAAPASDGQWRQLLYSWGEWPTLLSMRFPELRKLSHSLLRVEQAKIFDGLPPVFGPGTFAFLEERDDFPPAGIPWNGPEWERPIHAVRYKGYVICGYVDLDGDHLTLLPHYRSRGRRLTFLRRQVQMVGRWIGAAAPLHG